MSKSILEQQAGTLSLPMVTWGLRSHRSGPLRITLLQICDFPWLLALINWMSYKVTELWLLLELDGPHISGHTLSTSKLLVALCSGNSCATRGSLPGLMDFLPFFSSFSSSAPPGRSLHYCFLEHSLLFSLFLSSDMALSHDARTIACAVELSAYFSLKLQKSKVSTHVLEAHEPPTLRPH